MTDFVERDWKDEPNKSTPIDAAGLKDLERRLAGFTNTRIPQAAAAGLVAVANADGDVSWQLATAANMAPANVDGAAGTPGLRTLGTGAQQAARGSDAEYTAHKGQASGYMGLDANLRGAQSPKLHQADHEPGGADALTALTDASFAAANKDGAAGTPSLRTLGTGAQQAAQGSDLARVKSEGVRVLDYGADPTGAADSYAAFQSAGLAVAGAVGGSGKVIVPPGTFKLAPSPSSNPPFLVPRAFGGYKVEGAGKDLTAIQLSPTCRSLFAGNKITDHDIFQNVSIEDFAIDASLLPVGSSGGILWNQSYGGNASATRVGYTNIRVRRVKGFGAPVDPTLATHYRWVMFNCIHAAAGEGSQDQLLKMLFEDVELTGGNIGFTVFGSVLAGSALAANIFYDDIAFVRCSHDLLANNPSAGSLLNFQVGSVAAGGRIALDKCFGGHACDVSMEFDNYTDLLVDGCRQEECAGNSIYLVNFNYPTAKGVAPSSGASLVNSQKAVIHDNTVRRSTNPNAGLGYSIPSVGNMKLGKVTLDKCSYWRNTPELVGAPLGEVLNVAQQLDSLVIRRMSVLLEGISNAAAGSAWLAFIGGSAGPSDLVIEDLDMNVQGSTGAGTLPSLTYLRLAQMVGKVTVDRINLNGSLTNLGATAAYGIVLGGQAGNSIEGSFRRIRVASNPGTGFVAVYHDTTLVIPAGGQMTHRDHDFRQLAGTEFAYSGASTGLKPQIRVSNVVWKTQPSVHGFNNGGATGQAGSAGSPTMTGGAAGALADGTYRARIFSKDANGGLNNQTAELTVTLANGSAIGSIAFAWTAASNEFGGYRVYITDPGGATGSENHYFDVAHGTLTLTVTDLTLGTAGAIPTSSQLTSIYRNLDTYANEVGLYCSSTGINKVEVSSTGAFAGEQQTLYSSTAITGPFIFRLEPGWYARCTFSITPTWSMSPVAAT